MIPERARFTSAYDRSDYYGRVLKDYISMSIPTKKTRVKDQSALLLHRKAVEVYTGHVEVRNLLIVLRFFLNNIYGMYCSEANKVHSILEGVLGQLGILKSLKSRLPYVELPASYYVRPIQYSLEKIEDRQKYVRIIIKEFVNMTPLAEYEKTLPEGKTLFDDVWEHLSGGLGTDFSMQESYDELEAYVQHILQMTDVSDINECRERFLKAKEDRIRKLAEAREKERRLDLERKRDTADAIAADKAKFLHQALWCNMHHKEELKHKLYKREDVQKMEDPKVFVLISTFAKSSGTPPKFLMRNGELTSALTKAGVFSDSEPLPEPLAKMYEDCRFGYAELMLK